MRRDPQTTLAVTVALGPGMFGGTATVTLATNAPAHIRSMRSTAGTAPHPTEKLRKYLARKSAVARSRPLFLVESNLIAIAKRSYRGT
jgi:hypothetical protein